MKILHTSDWHIGRSLHGASLLNDQSALLLEQLLPLASDEKPDVLVVSGDVYDRAVPHHSAVELLDEILHKLVLDLGIPTIVIAGNHDSGERLSFGARLMAKGSLFVAGRFKGEVHRVTLADAHGDVAIYSIPYSTPADVRDALRDEEIRDHHAALSAVVRPVQNEPEHGEQRRIILVHAFLSGGTESESERPLVGAVAQVDTSCFDGFHYVAAGHLHRPQNLDGPRIRYSGSLMKYSFSEVDHHKSVSMVELDAKGEVSVREIPLIPPRDLRRISGTLEELLTGAPEDPRSDDYLEVTLTDHKPVYDAMRRLRAEYPNILHLRRVEPVTDGQAHNPTRDLRKVDDRELFRDFYKDVKGEPIAVEQAALYDEIIARVRDEDGPARR